MYFLVFLLVLLLCFTIAALIEPWVISVLLDTNNDCYLARGSWLFPFLTVKVEIVDTIPVLSVLIFRKQLYSKKIKPRKRKRRFQLQYLQSIDYHDAYMKLNFSAGNPFNTGITAGAVQMIPMLMKDVTVTEYPDFLANEGFFFVQAGTKVNIGKTIVQILRTKLSRKVKRGN